MCSTQRSDLEAWNSAVRWVARLSSLYASESEDRAVVINTVVGICYIQPDQKGKRMNLPSDWVSLVEGPCSQGLLETLCWKGSTAGYKQSSRPLQCICPRANALLDLVLANKDKMIREIIVSGSPGCSGCETVGFQILRELRRVTSRLRPRILPYLENQ